MSKIDEARIMLRLAATHRPILQKLFAGKIEPHELGQVAAAAGELGLFELAQLIRDFELAPTKDGLLGLVQYAGELDPELVKDLGAKFDSLRAVQEAFGKVFR